MYLWSFGMEWPISNKVKDPRSGLAEITGQIACPYIGKSENTDAVSKIEM